MEDVNLEGTVPKRVIIRPGTPLAAAIGAIQMFDRDYVQKGHKESPYHYRTYVAEDGTRLNVWHTPTTITAAVAEEVKE